MGSVRQDGTRRGSGQGSGHCLLSFQSRHVLLPGGHTLWILHIPHLGSAQVQEGSRIQFLLHGEGCLLWLFGAHSSSHTKPYKTGLAWIPSQRTKDLNATTLRTTSNLPSGDAVKPGNISQSSFRAQPAYTLQALLQPHTPPQPYPSLQPHPPPNPHHDTQPPLSF